MSVSRIRSCPDRTGGGILPKEVYEAMQKRAELKRKKFGKYVEADVVRTEVVKHLKEKGLLDKGKDYL